MLHVLVLVHRCQWLEGESEQKLFSFVILWRVGIFQNKLPFEVDSGLKTYADALTSLAVVAAVSNGTRFAVVD